MKSDRDREGYVFSPNGQFLAGGGPSIWRLDGSLVAELRGHRSGGRSVAFSPDGNLLLTASDSTVRLWDLAPKYAAELSDWRSDFSASINADGSLIATSGTSYEYDMTAPDMGIGRNNAIVLWDTRGNKLGEIPRSSGNRSARPYLSSDGSKLAVVEQRRAVLWDVARRQELATIDALPGAEVVGVSFAEPEGRVIVQAGGVVIVGMWNGAETTRLGSPEKELLHVALSGDGRRILTTDASGVEIFDLAGSSVAAFDHEIASQHKVVFSRDGRLVALWIRELETAWPLASGVSNRRRSSSREAARGSATTSPLAPAAPSRRRASVTRRPGDLSARASETRLAPTRPSRARPPSVLSSPAVFARVSLGQAVLDAEQSRLSQALAQSESSGSLDAITVARDGAGDKKTQIR